MFEIEREDGESFRDFQARVTTERALHDQSIRLARRNTLGKILRIEPHEIHAIVSLDGEDSESDGTTGVFIVLANYRFGGGDENFWAAIVDGKSTHNLFMDRPRAVLHALATEAGVDINEARFTVEAAARVLTIPTPADD